MPENESQRSELRGEYQRRMLAIRGAFEAGATGRETVAARAAAMDALIAGLWELAVQETPMLGRGIALLAVGGYGRRELFPYSDVDLLYLLDGKVAEQVRQPIRRMSQELWDAGIRLSPVTRTRKEAERFEADNVELALAMFDHRLLAGDAAVYERLAGAGLPRMLEREHKAIAAKLVDLTAERHAKYGDTLFHLEPNIKDCPGGLRDVHVCGWLGRLGDRRAGSQNPEAARPAPPSGGAAAGDWDEMAQAVEFLFVVRCFLHYRHERDDNTLDWQAQDAAAGAAIGLGGRKGRSTGQPMPSADAAYWMRLYFRHARSVERLLNQMLEEVSAPARKVRAPKERRRGRRGVEPLAFGFRLEGGRARLDGIGADAAGAVPGAAPSPAHGIEGDPANDPDAVLGLFAAMSRTGCALDRASEERMSQALPLLSAHLEEGPALWRHLQEILLGDHAGDTLRAMHALGILELLIPEFHGIDALVIRDAYHRYTVDEHTMVLIDTLHGLDRAARDEADAGEDASPTAEELAPSTGSAQGSGQLKPPGAMGEWSTRFGGLLRDLQHSALLYLAALLHDTGKGRSTGDHVRDSARMAESVLGRLELDGYESELVLGLIGNHLEMSAALRRDVFDAETVRGFAGKVQTPEALRMLTLLTYADIHAVHPDALTPWKAENLWRLYLATATYLDRRVDDDRVGARLGRELVHRVVSLLPAGKKAAVEAFLAGFPERYLRTRTPEQVGRHFAMAERIAQGAEEERVQLEFRYAAGTSEITLVTPDRALLFADMAGALAAWGMNIVTADAFSNRQGIVVDSFRFTDSFRTLEMNASEHDAFVASVRDVMAGKLAVERLLSGRRRGRRKAPKVVVESRVDFDGEASSHSTLLQVVAQDIPGLLRAVGLTLAGRGCNIEVALVDTEGETAIDVFYVTREGAKLDAQEEQVLKNELLAAMEANAR
jgi:[protein-PII] uridylyltransferase